MVEHGTLFFLDCFLNCLPKSPNFKSRADFFSSSCDFFGLDLTAPCLLHLCNFLVNFVAGLSQDLFPMLTVEKHSFVFGLPHQPFLPLRLSFPLELQRHSRCLSATAEARLHAWASSPSRRACSLSSFSFICYSSCFLLHFSSSDSFVSSVGNGLGTFTTVILCSSGCTQSQFQGEVPWQSAFS